jgi:hypothetical protein
VAIVSFSAPPTNSWYSGKSNTPWLCGYLPVSSEARAGTQTGLGANEFVNVVPRSPIAAFVLGSASHNGIVKASMSSTSTTTKFGRVVKISLWVTVYVPSLAVAHTLCVPGVTVDMSMAAE